MGFDLNAFIGNLMANTFFSFGAIYCKSSPWAPVLWGILYYIYHGADVNPIRQFQKIGQGEDAVGNIITCVGSFGGYVVGSALAGAFEAGGCGFAAVGEDANVFGAEILFTYMLLSWTNAENNNVMSGLGYLFVMGAGAFCNPWLVLVPRLVLGELNDGCGDISGAIWAPIIGPLAAAIVTPHFNNFVGKLTGAKDASAA